MTNGFSPIRRFQRFSVNLSVVCVSGERTIADEIVNLSLGGACVKTHTPLKPGSKHHFVITVPDHKLRASAVDVEAVVAWSSSDEHRMGLQFEQHSDGIDDYLRRLERVSNSL